MFDSRQILANALEGYRGLTQSLAGDRTATGLWVRLPFLRLVPDTAEVLQEFREPGHPLFNVTPKLQSRPGGGRPIIS